MKFAAAMLGVVMLGCELVTERDREELRQAFEAKDREIEALEAKVVRLEEALAEAQQARSMARDPGAVSPARTAELAALLGSPDAVSDALAQPGDAAAIAVPVAGPAAIICAEDRCTVPRKTFEALIADPDGLVKQARVVPVLKDGTTQGFKVFAIRAGSVLAMIGLKNGDRVTAIAGHSLANVEDALAAYAAIKGLREWTIAGERGGAPFERTVVIGD